MSIAPHPNTGIAVVDVGRGEVVVLDLEGGQLDAWPIGFRYKAGPVHRVGPYLLGETFVQDLASATRTERLLAMGDADTLTLAEVVIRTAPADFPTCGARIGLPRIFERDLIRWDSRNERTAVASDPDYVVRVFDGVHESAQMRRDLPALGATRDMALEKVAGGQRVGDCTIPPDELVRGRGFSPTAPRVRGVRVGPDREIWVERYGSDRTYRVDVFSPEGQYVGTLPAGTLFPLAFLDRDRILVLEPDDSGEPNVLAIRSVNRQ